MIRHDYSRVDPKRRANIDPKKRQFAKADFQQQTYDHRLSFYDVPPTAEITLDEFETWAISRLKGIYTLIFICPREFSNGIFIVLSELEACSFRNRSPEETAEYMKDILNKHLPLKSNSSKSPNLQQERKKDHYSHFILRLAFSSTEDLRRRYSRLETMLFRLRFKDDDSREKKNFVSALNLEWEEVGEDEKTEFRKEMTAAGNFRKDEEQEWFKVEWERVPELVEQRKVFLKRGKAYVPQREQMSLVVAEFTKRLDDALEVYPSFSFNLRETTNNVYSRQPALFPVLTKTTALPLSSPTFHNLSPPLTPPTPHRMQP